MDTRAVVVGGEETGTVDELVAGLDGTEVCDDASLASASRKIVRALATLGASAAACLPWSGQRRRPTQWRARRPRPPCRP